jgi:hypothetical protein
MNTYLCLCAHESFQILTHAQSADIPTMPMAISYLGLETYMEYREKKLHVLSLKFLVLK